MIVTKQGEIRKSHTSVLESIEKELRRVYI